MALPSGFFFPFPLDFAELTAIYPHFKTVGYRGGLRFRFGFLFQMITLQPVNKQYTLNGKRDTHSEFEVQAYLYNELQKLGYVVRGEVRWFDPETRIHCRFDLVIYDGDAPYWIIEVKPHAPGKRKMNLEDTRQGRRYRLFGIPVTFIYGISDATDFLMGKR